MEKVDVDSHENAVAVAGVKIDEARKEIDSLDLQIIDIMRRRRDISHQIQRQRTSEGGTRTVLSREKIIIDRYVAALGSQGATLALNVLSFCRGRLPESATEAGGTPRGNS
ncbi:chorismate mutase [Streptomyces mexicanus]|jgi:chorismate mutase|uniref:chorismate mutase n=1 Tax=Streptomyces mexicanus TaxID=178566 RepID=UPI0033784AD9